MPAQRPAENPGKHMTTLSQIAWDDTVLPFQLDRSDVRGRIARLDGVLDRVLAQHDYPPVVEALVAEAALLTALIGQTIKLRWKLSLQIRGNGPVRTAFYSRFQLWRTQLSFSMCTPKRLDCICSSSRTSTGSVLRSTRW